MIGLVCERFRRWLGGGFGGWESVADEMFDYHAPNGFDGVCHLRIFACPARWKRLVVIAGQLSDEVGASSIVNADEWIVAQIQDSLFPDGQKFVYIEHHPETVTGQPEPTFDVVELERHVSAEPELGWDFRALRRLPLAIHRVDGNHVELDLVPEVKLRVWPADDYTAYAIAGEEGALRMAEVARANSTRAAQAVEAAEAVSDAPPNAIVDVQRDAPEEDLPDSGE
jgi:hypothetical protein